jgi:ketosteroid isomerase-like protein
MSEENVARYPVPPVRPRSRRTLVERLGLRFPSLVRFSLSGMSWLPPRSRLRRELLARAIRDGAETYTRRDYEAFLIPFDPEVEFNVLGQSGGLDFESRSHGHDGLMRFFATIDEAFEDNVIEPQEAIDFGDRLLALYRLRTLGRGSGVELARDVGLLSTLRRGMIVRVDYYWSRDEALEAAGLSE